MAEFINESFENEIQRRTRANGMNTALKSAADDFMAASIDARYSYNFSWLGRPIIQYPQDVLALQEIIWKVKPDVIVETGIAHGGSLVLSASMLQLNAFCGGPEDAQVIGIDIEIRDLNRDALSSHPLARRIQMIEGSSVDAAVVSEVRKRIEGRPVVLVLLDSNHTDEHVHHELCAYAPMTSVGSYCVVFDTVIEQLPASAFPDRPWGPGNNPKTAVDRYVADHPEFEPDASIDNRLLISVARGGYLRRTR